jgi:hypothetical protein
VPPSLGQVAGHVSDMVDEESPPREAPRGALVKKLVAVVPVSDVM